jgi:hypothetical protein
VEIFLFFFSRPHGYSVDGVLPCTDVVKMHP